jgi:dihydroflavonol-4-reductase
VTVFVTGGSGVVGAALVDLLVDEGHHVRALSRSDASADKLERKGAEVVKGDVLARDTLTSAIGDAELVFHVAGVNEMCGRDPGAMVRANVEGSVNVMEAARTAGVERVVYTSSAATLGEVQGTVGTEDSPHRGWHLSDYERSKHLAEQAVMAIQGMDIVAVNPSSVQGPGRASGTGKIVLDVATGRLPAVVDTDVSIVDIDDCARGHLAAAERGRRGERYVLNSFTFTMREAIALLEDELGRSLGVRFLPRRVIEVVGMLAESLARLSGAKPPFCREMARTLLHGHRYDGRRARDELGITYTTAPELLSRLVEWYRMEGLISD